MARRSSTYGDWGQAMSLLGKLNKLAKGNLTRATRLGSQRARDIMVKKFVDSGPGWPPNAPSTIARKGSSKPNIDHADLMNSIVATPIGSLGSFVGVPRNAKNKDGDDLINIGAILTRGTADGRIPPRDFVESTLREIKPIQHQLWVKAAEATLQGKVFRG